MNTTSLREFVYKEAAEAFDPPLTRKDVTLLIEMVFEGVMLGLTDEGFVDEDGEHKVLLRTIGKFLRVTRKGRTYNVHGKLVEVADRDTVIFKPGSQLMKRLIGENWVEGVDNEDE